MPNYAIKRDLRETTGFKFIIGRVGPLFWLLDVNSMVSASTQNRLRSAAAGFLAGALLAVGTGLVIGAIQNMGFGLAVMLCLLGVPGALLAGIVNPRELLIASLLGAAASAIAVFAILATVMSRI